LPESGSPSRMVIERALEGGADARAAQHAISPIQIAGALDFSHMPKLLDLAAQEG
jgi:hypothetical protein